MDGAIAEATTAVRDILMRASNAGATSADTVDSVLRLAYQPRHDAAVYELEHLVHRGWLHREEVHQLVSRYLSDSHAAYVNLYAADYLSGEIGIDRAAEAAQALTTPVPSGDQRPLPRPRPDPV